MRTHLITAAASLLAGPALAATTWIAPLMTNSNANWPAVNGAFNQNYGIAFKTGSAGPFSMDWLQLRLSSSNVTGGPTATLKVALRNTTNDIAYSAVAGTTEYALDTVSFTLPATTSTYFDVNFDPLGIPNLAAFEMQPNTSYALILYSPSVNIGMARQSGYANGTTNDQYTTSEGFAVLDTFRNNLPNYSNNTSSYPSLAISFGAASAVPEPGPCVYLAAFAGGSLLFRRRTLGAR